MEEFLQGYEFRDFSYRVPGINSAMLSEDSELSSNAFFKKKKCVYFVSISLEFLKIICHIMNK